MNRPLLRQKLAIPAVWPEVVTRTRVEHLLDQHLAAGLHVAVLAATGFGKTTCLATWARRRSAIWLTLDAEDAQPESFLAYLITAFEQALPDFTTQARTLLGRAHEREGARAVLSELLADVDEQRDAPIILVIDDYHLAGSPTVDALLGTIIRYAPDVLRVVLAARRAPDVGVMGLQVQRRLAVIGADELAFDQDELRAAQPDLSADGLADRLAQTGGWPAGLGLAPGLLDAYLDEQFLAALEPATRSTLLRLAVVDAFDEALAAVVLSAPVDPVTWDTLRRDQLIVAHDQGVFAIHPALRSLLARRAGAAIPAGERQALLRRVGDHFWAGGQASTALQFWIDAGEEAWAAERLIAVAEDWLADDRLDALMSAITSLGDAAKPAELVGVEGEIYRRWGEFGRAEACFDRAVELAAAGPEASCAGLRLRQAQNDAARGLVDVARRRLDEARGDLADGQKGELDALNLDAGLALMEGATERAAAKFGAALALAGPLGDDFAEARAQHNLGICYIRLGEFEQALACYDAALAKPRADGTPRVWMSPVNRALVLAHLYRLPEAQAAAEDALKLVRRYQLTREEGYALRVLALVHMRSGALDAAHVCIATAASIARRTDDRLGQAFSLNFQAELALLRGDVDAAQAALAEIDRTAAALATSMPEFAQVRARVVIAAGQREQAAELVADLVDRARAGGYRRILADAEDLLRALAEGRPPATEVAVPPAPAGEAASSAASPPALRIRCFGGLRVWRGDVEIADREWQTERAKALFVYLLFAPEGATKQRLLEAVFPGEELSNGHMNMTLTRMRKALEPELERGRPSRFILRSHGRYVFDHQARVTLDVHEFDEALRVASGPPEARRAALERALTLYRDGFLPEFDTPWVASLRSAYLDRAMSACRQLIALLEANDPDAVPGVLRRALEINPVSEEFHRELILRHIEADEPHRALMQYRQCEQRFWEVLDRPPPQDLAKLVGQA